LRRTAALSPVRNLIPLIFLLPLGCVSPTERADKIATQASLEPLELTGNGFTHRAFYRAESGGLRLIVFVDGDGSPWVNAGRDVASDPTPRNPLALRLAARTHESVLYLGRPCYLGLAHDSNCSAELWTSARYSESVVTSMVVALERFMNGRGFTEIVLVGYSGGGTVAVLMAPSLPFTTKVVTIAANLDVAAWTRAHSYLSLNQSLDPAELPPLPASIAELHLVGGHDLNVPRSTTARYLDRLPSASVLEFPDFDHVCCWERDWDSIWQRVQRGLGAP
jgi:pimeloyl-ACP methyl ester carboxylesterase